MGDNSIDRFNGLNSSLAVKAPCVAVALSNITLSGEQTVNGTAVVSGDRVLATAQTLDKDNGIYDVATSAWSRSPDFDGNRDAINGTLVVVATTPVVGFYQLTGTNPIVIGTSDLTFTVVTDLALAVNLGLTTPGQGASLVAIEDAGTFLTADDVEAALAELFETPSATTRRLLELATQAEVDTGTDAVRVITPATNKPLLAVEKSSTETTNTDVNLSDDADLTLALTVGTWHVTGTVFLGANTDGSMGLKWKLNYPGSIARSRMSVVGMINGAVFVESSPISTEITHATIIVTGGDLDFLRFDGIIVVTGADTLAFQWAQNSSNANNLVINNASTLFAQKIA